jgi:cyclophilin family peptidyl-prolyl cis-trans isomerase
MSFLAILIVVIDGLIDLGTLSMANAGPNTQGSQCK